MSVSLGEKREVLKINQAVRKGDAVLGVFFRLFSQTITNFGSDDILILSL